MGGQSTRDFASYRAGGSSNVRRYDPDAESLVDPDTNRTCPCLTPTDLCHCSRPWNWFTQDCRTKQLACEKATELSNTIGVSRHSVGRFFIPSSARSSPCCICSFACPGAWNYSHSDLSLFYFRTLAPPT